MPDFWASLSNWLTPATLAGVAWIIKGQFAADKRMAVIETRLGHLEAEQHGKG